MQLQLPGAAQAPFWDSPAKWSRGAKKVSVWGPGLWAESLLESRKSFWRINRDRPE